MKQLIIQLVIEVVMREENNKPQTINILCVGEMHSGKTYFLKHYTKDQSRQTLAGPYDIYAKKLNHLLVYFHELSQYEDLYLQNFYNGIIFFVDLIGTWNVVERILNWVELQSKFTGQNIFKIPLLIVITKTRDHKNSLKWRKILQQDLCTVVKKEQILYFQNSKDIKDNLEEYLYKVAEGRASGLMPSNQNHIKLYGFNHILKIFSINFKLTFFRFVQLYNKNVKQRLAAVVKQKNPKKHL